MYREFGLGFIQKVEMTVVPDTAFLVTFDVESLYTSIPHEDLRSVVQLYLEKDISLQVPVHFVLDLVDLLLEKNYFRFEDTFYLQTKGVSMRSSFAPSISNLFMAQLEDKYILNKDFNLFFKDIILFYQYIDDCFCVYSNIQSLQAFST